MNSRKPHRSLSVQQQTSSSYPVYPTHRKTMIRVMEGRKTANHTYNGECAQRVPRLKQQTRREIINEGEPQASCSTPTLYTIQGTIPF